jgi:uncharacterized protein
MKWLAIIFGIAIFAALFTNAVATNPNLTIVGEGTVTVPADTATISVSVESSNDDTNMAQADVQEKMNNAIDALKTAGVKDEEILPGQSSGVTSIQSSSKVCRQVNNTTVCDNRTEQVSSMERSTVIRLKTTDESKINSVLNAAKSAGANAYVTGYGLDDTDKAVTEARKKAVANARENAEGMAKSAGASLGKVLDISEYAYPVIFGDPSLGQTGMVDVTCYVVVTYEIAA